MDPQTLNEIQQLKNKLAEKINKYSTLINTMDNMNDNYTVINKKISKMRRVVRLLNKFTVLSYINDKL